MSLQAIETIVDNVVRNAVPLVAIIGLSLTWTAMSVRSILRNFSSDGQHSVVPMFACVYWHFFAILYTALKNVLYDEGSMTVLGFIPWLVIIASSGFLAGFWTKEWVMRLLFDRFIDRPHPNRRYWRLYHLLRADRPLFGF